MCMDKKILEFCGIMQADPHQECLNMEGLTNQALVQVAEFFQALAEPARLQVLNLLRERERSVGELAQLCGYSSANISRHLALLTRHGIVARESRGNSAIYSIADESIYALCDLACGSIERKFERTVEERAAFIKSPAPRGKARAQR